MSAEIHRFRPREPAFASRNIRNRRSDVRSHVRDSFGRSGIIRRNTEFWSRWQRAGVAGVFAALLSAAPSVAMVADDAPIATIPAGVHVFFHLRTTLSSDASKTGDAFTFTLAKPIESAGVSIPIEGTIGQGTVYLAGKAGTSGHEGDLTLRLDSLRTADGRTVTFENEQLQINGRNRKVASGVLGLIPYVGAASIFIRGSEIRVDPSVSVENILGLPALVYAPIDVTACAPHGVCDARGFTVAVVAAGADDHGPILRFTLRNDTDAPIDFAPSATVDQDSLIDVVAKAPPHPIANHCPSSPAPIVVATPSDAIAVADAAAPAGTAAQAAPTPPAVAAPPSVHTIAPHGSLTVVADGLLCKYDVKTAREYKGTGSMGGPVFDRGHDAGYAMSIPAHILITP